MVTKDDTDDLLPKLPEVETTCDTTPEEKQDTKQVIKQDQELLAFIDNIQPELTANRTLEVESNVIKTSSQVQEISLLLPSVEDVTVVRTEESAILKAEDNVLLSDVAHLISVQDIQQSETAAETTLHNVTVEVGQQQQQQKQVEEEETVATLMVSESIDVVPKPVISTVTELPVMPAYPRLDSLIAGE